MVKRSPARSGIRQNSPVVGFVVLLPPTTAAFSGSCGAAAIDAPPPSVFALDAEEATTRKSIESIIATTAAFTLLGLVNLETLGGRLTLIAQG
jgi:hypothetical protein